MNILNIKNIIMTITLLLIFPVGFFVFLPDGKSIFIAQRCITCHGFKGEGGLTGPDLTEVSKRRSNFWIAKQIKNPKSHNPDSRMPSYEYLSYAEIYALIQYLKP